MEDIQNDSDGDHSQYDYNSNEDEYEYEFEEDMEQSQFNKISPTNVYTGLNIGSDLNIILSDISRRALYPVYKQLSEICLVDVDSQDFYSATLTMVDQKQQILIAQLSFPKIEPFFPNYPPQLILQSKFIDRFQKYNFLFNCHPRLLSYNWNICTDIVQIIRDLLELSATSKVETNDEDYLINQSPVRKLINIINMNKIDITNLFPNEHFKQLHSFGILHYKNNNLNNEDKTKSSSGTGYSTSIIDYNKKEQKLDKATHQCKLQSNIGCLEEFMNMIHTPQSQSQSHFSSSLENTTINHNDQTVHNSSSSSNSSFTNSYNVKMLLGGVDIDMQCLVDCIYFLIHHFVSVTITVEEFFSNLEFYTMVLDYLLRLPKPSSYHIEAIPSGLSTLLQTIHKQDIKLYVVEQNELDLITKLELLCQQPTNILYSSPPSPTSSAGKEIMMTIVPIKKRTVEDECTFNTSYSCDDQVVAYDVEKERNKNSRVKTSSSSSSLPIVTPNNDQNTKKDDINSRILHTNSDKNSSSSHSEVIMIEEPFRSHLFLNKIQEGIHLPSKWFRKLRFELVSMPQSVPSNVIVLSGIQCSQPNLMKVFMFPESTDTPYYGGCFEFDFYIPSDYPDVPPKVLLVTTGYGMVRFNPNLYNCGKVCLSLLGTWAGEPWVPGISNLTQVINSILFLIFIEEPYYNEPGFTKSTSADIQSLIYNENIRRNTLKYAYLDFFTNKSIHQYSDKILPILCKNWKTKGKEVAEKWLKNDPISINSNDNNSNSIVQLISNEVVAYEESKSNNSDNISLKKL